MKKSEKVLSKDTTNLLTNEEVEKFKIIFPMIKAIKDEMKALSLKKQDGVLNKLKIKMINKLIESALELLSKEASLQYLEKLDEEMLPQNSDVVLILSQYVEALIQLKSKNQIYTNGTYLWKTQEAPNPKKQD